MDYAKGVLNLQIQIDYESMFDGDKLQVIENFTGVEGIKENVENHLNNLANEIKSLLKDKPLTIYNLEGKVYSKKELEHSQNAEDDTESNEVEVVDEQQGDTGKTANPSDKNNDLSVVSQLQDDIMDISSSHGIPLRIMMNHEVSNQIKKKLGINDEKDIDNFLGFDAQVEAMAEKYNIEYKRYDNGETDALVRE
ncbi:hypothetical protein RVS70_05290 [Virgibacillus sp. M23]|uniref:hypothetical protein n=1 Tax=Virgibacillus sp. M23 TaxID=3079030 RepID=UPI002A90EB24|nr:hypothetical protein [Virgibacillus sp. M23]MDY7043615.1 hypothetical protein [Virgibacillus sp. M23]